MGDCSWYKYNKISLLTHDHTSPDHLKLQHLLRRNCETSPNCNLINQTKKARNTTQTGSQIKLHFQTNKSTSSMASSSVLNVLTHRTGPKTSSLQICMEVVTSLIMVGSMKKPLFKCCHYLQNNKILTTIQKEATVMLTIKTFYLGTIPTTQYCSTFTRSCWNKLWLLLILQQMKYIVNIFTS